MRSAIDMRNSLQAGSVRAAPPSRRQFAAVEPFGENQPRLLAIADRFVEGLHRLVSGPHPQLQFLDAGLAQPTLGRVHDRAAETFLLVGGIDRDVIDPAAMAVMPGQYGGRDRIAVAAD